MSATLQRAGLGARFRYRFDNAMSRGPGVIILWLFVATIAFVFLVALVLTIFGVGINEDANPTLLERFWQSFLRILDPGTFSGDSGWSLRVAMLLVTLLGVLIGGSLIGLIVAAVDNRVEQLRRGRSLVVERDHTLILGWSPRVFTLVTEIVIANENQSRACIVVLAPQEKPDMEEELRTRVPNSKNTEIVCRTGDPASLQDLTMVNVTEARSVVALGTGEDDGPGDAEAVKAVLAVMSTDPELRSTRIVVELNDAETARALREASHDRVITVRAAEVISRITAQACRESGLSAVWRDLLDFEGDEIYFHRAPELDGRTFGEALLAYDVSTVIGRYSADGTVTVNPPMETRFERDDRVIAISEDDDTVVFTGFVEESVLPAELSSLASGRPQRFLVVGWSHIGPVVLRELDQFAPMESTVDVLVDPDLVRAGELVELPLRRMAMTFRSTHGNLDELGHAREHGYDKAVVLGYRYGITPSEADARSLLTLLLLQRSLVPTEGGRVPPMVTELLDSRNVDLARATGADDFVVSDELSSLMLAQLAERPELEAVFEDLFDVEGSALVLRPASSYVDEVPGPFRRVVAAARARGEVAIGYRRQRGDDGLPENVLNPAKSKMVQLGDDDKIVVIAPV